MALLNIDNKLYWKALASHLDEVRPDLIHKHQSGFVRHRQTHDSLRHFIHLIEKDPKKYVPTIIAALDAKKAFDRVEWGILAQYIS